MLRTRLVTTKKKKDVCDMKGVQDLPPLNLGISVTQGSNKSTRWINHRQKQKAKHKQYRNLNDITVGKP